MKIKVDYTPEYEELVVSRLGNRVTILTKEFLETIPF